MCSRETFSSTITRKVEETFNVTFSWTIYFLVDIKVVYIIMFAFISTINLISSTANVHASTDKTKMTLFNVSSEYMNVYVTSINDAVLWNCRTLSDNKNYYKNLYWMVIVVMILVMTGFLAIKLITLITVSNNCGCKCCICLCSTFKHSLTKLWYIAIIAERSAMQQQQCRHMEIYKNLLKKNIPHNVVQKLPNYNNFCRSIIPYILLSSLVTILCLICLSFDLHPLACITKFEEDLVTYDPEVNRVELKFSNHLLILQEVAAFLVIFLLITYTVCVKLFFCCTEKVIEELKDKVKELVDEELNQQPNLETTVQVENYIKDYDSTIYHDYIHLLKLK